MTDYYYSERLTINDIEKLKADPVNFVDQYEHSFFDKAQQLYEQLPDGIHKHADGELYLHQTFCDPRNPNNKGLITISKLYD